MDNPRLPTKELALHNKPRETRKKMFRWCKRRLSERK